MTSVCGFLCIGPVSLFLEIERLVAGPADDLAELAIVVVGATARTRAVAFRVAIQDHSQLRLNRLELWEWFSVSVLVLAPNVQDLRPFDDFAGDRSVVAQKMGTVPVAPQGRKRNTSHFLCSHG